MKWSCLTAEVQSNDNSKIVTEFVSLLQDQPRQRHLAAIHEEHELVRWKVFHLGFGTMAASAARDNALLSLHLHNFKRFDDLTINLKEHALLISGPNGSGKTQLLWALLLFFRAINTRAEDSQRKKHKQFNIQPELSTLLCRSLAELRSFSSFVKTRDNEGAGEATFTGTFSEGNKITVALHSNGALEFRDPPEVNIPEKLRFAYVTASPVITADTSISSALVSETNNIRLLYTQLSDESRIFVAETLRMLFGVTSIKVTTQHDAPAIILTDACLAELELMHHGAALKKVFIILVFISQLAQAAEPHRFLLIDELECHLYPSLLVPLTTCLKSRAGECGIKLIVTSIAHDVIERFPPDQSLYLSAETTTYSTITTLMRQLPGFLGLDRNKVQVKGILIVDGANDAQFVKNHARFGSDILVLTASMLTAPKGDSSRLKETLSGHYRCAVVHLRDPEFLPVEHTPPSSVAVGRGVHEVYWSLPCIESFLILNDLLSHSTRGPNPDLVKYFANTGNYLQYIRGAIKSLEAHKKPAVDSMISAWSWCAEESRKDEPDLQRLILYIHGHTWATMVSKATSLWILEALSTKLHPDVAGLVDAKLSLIQQLFRDHTYT